MIFIPIGQALSLGESSAAFWRAQVAGWVVLATIGFCSRWVVFGNGTVAFWVTIGVEPVAFAMTSAAAVWHGRHPRPHASIQVLASALLLCVAASAALAGIAYAIHQLFEPGTVEVSPGEQYRLGFIYYMGLLSIWTLIYFGVSAELAARAERISKMKAETRALRLELEYLKLQIEPHFLFNALNTIVAEIADRPTVAEEMTRGLASYLRYSLDRRGRGMCRLAEEIEAAETYIRIQALRFDKKLAYRCHVDPASLELLVPHMTMQGLVENAIKHGMRSEYDQFLINIRTRVQGDELIIEVDNPGELHAPYDLARSGGGLGNLCRRLALRYPERHTFSLEQRDDKIVAEVRIKGEPLSLL